jgi:hypothetical protein
MTHWALTLWRRAMRRIGSLGLLGLFLLILAGTMGLATDLVLRAAEQRQQVALAAAAPVGQRERGAARPGMSTEQQLSRFVTAFPTMAQNADDVATLFAAAQRHGVRLAHGDYLLSAEPGSGFLVYTASFPITEGYGAIKAFTADVLRSLPHASMDELRMERPESNATSLAARIRISLVYRAA